MLSSRTLHLRKTLEQLDFNMGLKAYHLVIREMCAEKGYMRHNSTHYYHHLVDVTQKIINYKFIDEDIITAALLHDLVEDVSDYSIDWIENEFNENIATMVQLVTKDKNLNYKESIVLKNYLDLISTNFGASLIKTADRIHNSMTLQDASLTKKIRYANEIETHYIPFFKKCRNLYSDAASFFFEAKTQVEPIVWEIKQNYEQQQILQGEIDQLKKQLSQCHLKLKES